MNIIIYNSIQMSSSIVVYNGNFNTLKHKHQLSGKEVNVPTTATRIPDKNLKIAGGKYHISTDDEALFYAEYVDYVLIHKNPEYLTEIQLHDDTAPILVDLDFRYPLDTEQRLYTEQHIIAVVDAYLDELPNIFNFTNNQSFPLFVFERDDIYKKHKNETLTEVKDGIHIIIGIQLEHKYQMVLRDNMMKHCEKKNIFTDLNLVKGLEDVFDDKISAGTSGWQVYGSTKPGYKPYALTKYIQITYDASDGQFQMDERKVTQFMSPENIHANFNLLRARYTKHLKPELVPNIDKMEVALNKGKPIKGVKKPLHNNEQVFHGETRPQIIGQITDLVDLTKITNAEELNTAVQVFLNSLTHNEYTLKEAHDLTQILPEKYYKNGSHFDSRLVAFALKNTDSRLFISWVMMRSKADDFNYADIPDLYEKWTKYFNINGENHATIGSLIYWAKNDAPEAYQHLKQTNINTMMEEMIKNYTDGKVARLLKQLFGDTFVCSDIENKHLYIFQEHHWVRDKGFTLRKLVSSELLPMFEKKGREAFLRCIELTEQEGTEEGADEINIDPATGKNKKNESESMLKIKTRLRKISEVCNKLDSTATKNNSFREALEVFYDPNFKGLLNTQKWLLCFKNGVLDIKNKIFRTGVATDYISLTTKIDYQPLSYYLDPDNTEIYGEIVANIETFFSQLFPTPSLQKYMWDHLGSVLIGERIEQVFNIYVGSGCNGKSLLCDLMKMCLGQYKALVPINMITGKRQDIGSATPEMMALKGARYAVFQEPDKNSPLNEGYIKELTGEAQISGRELFGSTEEFDLQANLAACMNSLFEIKGDDDGIWRRLKVVKFMSKFVDEGEKYNHTTPYIFKKDKTLGGKLHLWAPIFMSMLVEVAFENQGVVKDCEEVIRDTNEYRQNQDVIQCFFAAKIEVVEEKKCQIGSQNLHRSFKEWYNFVYSDRHMPKLKDLDAAMNKMYGDKTKNASKKWNYVRIILDDKENAVEAGEEDGAENDDGNDES